MRLVRVNACNSPKLLTAVALFILGISACALPPLDETYVSEAFVIQRWLSFIEDSKTTRTDIVTSLGEPTGSFEDGRILVYKLILADGATELTYGEYRKRFVFIEAAYTGVWLFDVSRQRRQLAQSGVLSVVRPEDRKDKYLRILSREGEYDLVLIFDESGLLKKHTLSRVGP